MGFGATIGTTTARLKEDVVWVRLYGTATLQGTTKISQSLDGRIPLGIIRGGMLFRGSGGQAGATITMEQWAHMSYNNTTPMGVGSIAAVTDGALATVGYLAMPGGTGAPNGLWPNQNLAIAFSSNNAADTSSIAWEVAFLAHG